MLCSGTFIRSCNISERVTLSSRAPSVRFLRTRNLKDCGRSKIDDDSVLYQLSSIIAVGISHSHSTPLFFSRFCFAHEKSSYSRKCGFPLRRPLQLKNDVNCPENL